MRRITPEDLGRDVRRITPEDLGRARDLNNELQALMTKYVDPIDGRVVVAKREIGRGMTLFLDAVGADEVADD